MAITSRRAFLGYTAAAGVSMFHIGKARADEPEFKYKWATNPAPDHPINVRGMQAMARIKEKTGGRVVIDVFPNNQLGSDTDLFAQVRSGAVDFYSISPILAATVIPAAAISGVSFVFKDRESAFAAVDGDLGAHVRGEVAKTSIIALDKPFEIGFRQISSSTHPIYKPADLKGMKIRVPPGPLYLSPFQTLGALPTTINFNEVYTALQTKIVDGQDNPLPFVQSQRFYEVQKYISLTNHIWDCQYVFANKRAFQALPDNLQTIVLAEFSRAAEEERQDIGRMNETLVADFKRQGLVFNDTNPMEFRDALRAGGYYQQWHEKFGDAPWRVLEHYAGQIS
jgi:tripartite ATP-independent transporter DctP family solute receptor